MRFRIQNKRAKFDQAILPHVDAAYNLARWLTGNDHDAEDRVQDACLRAFQFFDSFHGENGRAWLLTIVRNTCYTWLQKNRAHEILLFDEEKHILSQEAEHPEKIFFNRVDKQLLRQAIEELPVEFREVIVLRELEDLSYKEIAAIAEIPVGTVMSRLARARKRLEQGLSQQLQTEVEYEL